MFESSVESRKEFDVRPRTGMITLNSHSLEDCKFCSRISERFDSCPAIESSIVCRIHEFREFRVRGETGSLAAEEQNETAETLQLTKGLSVCNLHKVKL